MLKFGDIFKYKENVYIYLTAKDDGGAYYVAKVIDDPEMIKDLINRKQSNSASKIVNITKQNALKNVICFFTITTNPFKDFLGHLAGSDRHIQDLSSPFVELGKLNKEDLINLKKEISENDDVLPKPLIKYLQELKS